VPSRTGRSEFRPLRRIHVCGRRAGRIVLFPVPGFADEPDLDLFSLDERERTKRPEDPVLVDRSESEDRWPSVDT
jgi:hypothetical protein